MEKLVQLILLFLVLLLFIIVNYSSKRENFALPSSKIGIATLMRHPVDLPLWLKYHRDLGISNFFIQLEDSNGLEDLLKNQPDITLTVGKSSDGNNYNTLMDRQKEFVNKVLKDAKNKDLKFLFHIDSDELIHGDLSYLDNLSADVKTIKLENVEALYDGDENTCFSSVKFKRCKEAGSNCRSYANGKSAARIIDNVSLAGPHDFSVDGKLDAFEVPFDKLKILHFDSCTLSAWVDKFGHLGKKKEEGIPFSYYNKSIDLVKNIQNEYKKLTGENKGNGLFMLDEKIV